MLEHRTPEALLQASRSASPPILPLSARGLVFRRDGQALIDDVSLDIPAGTVTAVLGPNGAGKSLLLRLLHGLLTPDRGQVLWAGRPADRAIRRRQAMVFQKPVMLRRSVAANLRFGLTSLGMSRRATADAVAHWLDAAGLAALADRPARLLSGGEQQRLAMVRALIRAPDILFLDEPTASLDPRSVHGIESLVRAAHRSGAKVIIVTHDAAQARRLADDVVFLHRGRVVERRDAEAFFAGPSSPQANAYLDGQLVI